MTHFPARQRFTASEEIEGYERGPGSGRGDDHAIHFHHTSMLYNPHTEADTEQSL